MRQDLVAAPCILALHSRHSRRSLRSPNSPLLCPLPSVFTPLSSLTLVAQDTELPYCRLIIVIVVVVAVYPLLRGP